jgi:lactate 2-monooxygenase
MPVPSLRRSSRVQDDPVTDTETTAPAASAPGLAEYQNEIYLRGLGDETPTVPVSVEALESAAYAAMSAESVGYVAGGAGAERTVAANRTSLDRWRIVPRMLRGVAERDLRTTLFGASLPAPVLLGPVGVQQIIHPEGELATARGAAELGVPYVLSTASSTAMEEVVAAAPDAPRWYQLYWPKNRDLCLSLVERAHAAGFSALVVTLDTWMLGWRPRDLQRAYLPFLRGVGIANYTSDPVFSSLLPEGMPRDQAEVLTWAANFADPSLTWSDIAWLRERTSLPLVLKGISCAGDAALALDVGADAVQVSNHGGRQVDGAVAAIDALPEVVDTLAGRVPVLFDSGIRTGADAVKALALGADAVMLGRLYTWGLALGGAAGVTAVLRAFLADLDNTMALSGHARPSELTRSSLTRVRD